MLKNYIWFLTDKISILESFLGREKAREIMLSMHFISTKPVNTEPLKLWVQVFPLWFVGCWHSANQRQKVAITNLETSAKLICISMDNFKYVRALWISYIVFTYLTTLRCIISKFVIPLSVNYFSGHGFLRKQGQIISHYSQYSLTQSQKLTICLMRGNI